MKGTKRRKKTKPKKKAAKKNPRNRKPSQNSRNSRKKPTRSNKASPNAPLCAVRAQRGLAGAETIFFGHTLNIRSPKPKPSPDAPGRNWEMHAAWRFTGIFFLSVVSVAAERVTRLQSCRGNFGDRNGQFALKSSCESPGVNYHFKKLHRLYRKPL